MSEYTLSANEAEDYVYGGHVAIQDVAEHRWYMRQLVVIRWPDDGDPLVGFYYLKPASELQEGQDRFDSDPVKCFPVSAREVVQTVYEVVA